MKAKEICGLVLVLLLFAMLMAHCTHSSSEGFSLPTGDVIEDIDDSAEEDIEEDIEDSYEPLVPDECIECKMYFCPPLDSIWQKEICIDKCEDPPIVLSETECTEYFECDPTQYFIEQVDCFTSGGYPGV